MKVRELTGDGRAEGSAAVLGRVIRARARQSDRFGDGSYRANGQMSLAEIETHCRLDASSQALVERAIDRLGLSARAYSRILKVARTIADLDESDDIQASHVAEAIGYRSLDRKGI